MSYEYRLQQASSTSIQSGDYEPEFDMQFEDQANDDSSQGENQNRGSFNSNGTSNFGDDPEQRQRPVQELSGADLKMQFSTVSDANSYKPTDAQLFSSLVESNNLANHPMNHGGKANRAMPDNLSRELNEKRLLEQQFGNLSGSAFVAQTQTPNSVMDLSESQGLQQSLFEKLSVAHAAQNMAFSIQFGSGRTVDVQANNLPDRWTIALLARDPDFKKRLEGSQDELARNMQDDMGKRVDIQVK